MSQEESRPPFYSPYVLEARKTISLPLYFPESCVTPKQDILGRPQPIKDIHSCFRCLDFIRGYSIHDGPSICAVHGPGGIGKTEVARDYIVKHQDDFDAIFFLVADGISRLSEQYLEIASKLGLIGPQDRPEPDICREIVKSWLRNPFFEAGHGPSSSDVSSPKLKRAKWLIVFDHVDDPRLLEDYWPTNANGLVLITTRDTSEHHRYSNLTVHIDIVPLSLDEATALLKHLAKDETASFSSMQANDNALQVIVPHLDMTPLTIRRAGKVMADRNISYEQLVRFPWGHRPNNIFDNFCNKCAVGDRLPCSIDSMLSLDTLEVGASELLYVISMLDPERIPESIFSANYGKVRDVHFLADSLEYIKARTSLVERSLIEWNPADRLIEVHRNVQFDAGKIARQRGESLELYFSIAVDLIGLTWSSRCKNDAKGSEGMFAQPPQCSDLLPHVVHLANKYEELREGLIKTPQFGFVDLLTEAAW